MEIMRLKALKKGIAGAEAALREPVFAGFRPKKIIERGW